MISIKPGDLPLPKWHEHLLAAVAPRPIAFVSTIDKEGNVNLSPFSFFNCFGSNPPTLIYSPARSGRSGHTKNTHDNVLEVPECVVNIGHYEMMYQMNLAAHMFPKGVDEFAKSGLTPVESVTVKPPRVGEAYVQMECKVKQVIATGEGGGAGNLVICEVTLIHINEKVMDAQGSIDPLKMDYIARMSKNLWCRIGEENIFEVPGFKMPGETGIGFDQLPPGIRHSKYLTGNDLAQIAASDRIPTEKELFDMGLLPEIKIIVDKFGNDFPIFEREMHLLAKQEIEQHNSWLAFKILMVVEFTRESLVKE
ncbi:MAG: flavin reductase family protein [Bacteroidetes bacterium]|nr:flavin reductase family protein [Bacteroidota bacterium]